MTDHHLFSGVLSVSVGVGLALRAGWLAGCGVGVDNSKALFPQGLCRAELFCEDAGSIDGLIVLNSMNCTAACRILPIYRYTVHTVPVLLE